MRFTISRKIFLGVAIILIAGTVSTILIYSDLRVAERQLHKIIEVEKPTRTAAYEMEINLIEIGFGVLEYLNTGEKHVRARVKDDHKEFQSFKVQYDRLVSSEKEKDLGDKLTRLYNEFNAVSEVLMDKRDRGEQVFETAEFHQFVVLRGEIDNILDTEIQAAVDYDLSTSMQETEAVSHRALLTTVISLPVFIFFGFGAGWLLMRFIHRPLTELTKGTEEVGRGNLDYRTPIKSNDEIGDLARYFNRMVAQLEQTTVPKPHFVEASKRLSTEVSERLQVEKSLGESEERYRRLVELSPDAIFVNRNNRIVFINRAGMHLFGAASPDEIIGKSPFFFFHPEYHEMIKERIGKMLESKGSVALIEEKIVQLNGKMVDVEVAATSFEDEEGAAILVILRDISARKKAEEELRRAEERLRTIISNAPLVLFLLDENGKILVSEGSALKNLGLKPGENVGKSVFDIYRDNELIISDVKRAFKGESFAAIEKADGRTFEVWYTPMLNGGKKVKRVIGVAIDVTEQKQVEEALQESEEKFRQAQKLEAIGQLAGGIAHDFNNMLTAIDGYASLVLDKLSTDDPLRPPIEEIKKAGERSAQLTQQLLAFSRKQILQPKILDLNEIVSNSSRMLKRLIGENIDLVTTLRPSLGRIKADPGQIEQIIINLVVNAKDAMPTGGRITIETANTELDEHYANMHITVTSGKYVMLTVSDTGSGMDAETQKKIFEPFFTTKEVGKGTGLGLATVYGIVKQSGGNIWVYSEPGKGTAFKIYFPQVELEADKSETLQPAQEITKGTETILLVEDEELVRKLIHQVLAEQGFEVLSASTAAEALRIAQERSGRIDLLLTDVVMPQMNGRELSEKITQFCPQVRVLFMSGYTDDTIVHYGVLDDDVVLLEKPFTAEGLTRKVREVLDTPAGE